MTKVFFQNTRTILYIIISVFILSTHH